MDCRETHTPPAAGVPVCSACGSICCKLSVAAALRLCNLQFRLYITALQDDGSSAGGGGGRAAAAQDSPAPGGDGSNAGTDASVDGGGGTGVDLGANDDTAAQDDAPDAGEAQQPQVSGQPIGRQTSPACLILVVSFRLPRCRYGHVMGILCCVTLPQGAKVPVLDTC